ncbi:hypothetical protein HOD30_04855 [Candidatus Peregrinibacteria bacterium]|jgi:hypothetical protein|nr:hypothetical protein [Candidatus Peregrinibacteria bacterium]MBT4631734.1 hypothetical protein [Candidatus Peregrinibacteria bacterium]
MTSNEPDQSYNKILAYFRSIIKTETFERKVEAIRKECEVPPFGFIPEVHGTNPPERKKHEKKLFKKAATLAGEYGLKLPFWEDVIIQYILFSEIDLSMTENYSLVHLRDIPNSKEGAKYNSVWREYNNYEDEFYPICLMISPYASRRDIEDFIKKNFSKQIKPALKEHRKPGIDIGKKRIGMEYVRARNEFIYNHKNLPLKEIGELVKKEFGEELDDGYIGKIISMEKKARK